MKVWWCGSRPFRVHWPMRLRRPRRAGRLVRKHLALVNLRGNRVTFKLTSLYRKRRFRKCRSTGRNIGRLFYDPRD